MNLIDKTILITGASQGLGKEIVKKTAKEGAKVILLARREVFLKEIKDEISKEKGIANYYVCDIRDPNQVKGTVKKIVSKYKEIDILINNAGVWTDDGIEKVKPEQRKNAFETNVFGHVQVTEEILPYLNKKESIIFNVISTSGVPDIPSGNNLLWKSYGASKWGMVGYTQALRESLRDTNTKVIQYFPGGFESNLYENAGRENPHNQPWMMKTEDVADIVLFALTRPKDVYMEKIVVSKKK
jgi:NADP-dependent 3-hydroxy acid dehydrogenase YdfG